MDEQNISSFLGLLETDLCFKTNKGWFITLGDFVRYAHSWNLDR